MGFYGFIYLMAAPTGWLLGVIPALIAGLATATIWPRFVGTPAFHLIFRIITGGSFGYISASIYHWSILHSIDFKLGLSFDIIGAISAACCGALTPNSWINPEKTFKMMGLTSKLIREDSAAKRINSKAKTKK